MKQTVLLFGVFCLFSISAAAQEPADLSREDSLAGFDRSAVQMPCELSLDSAGVASVYAAAERRYIDYKYQLGIYSPDYVYPGKYYNNSVFPVAACTNVDFETGTFAGWAGTIGDNTIDNLSPFTNIQNGFFSTSVNAPISDGSARHTIVTPLGGNDPYGGFPVVSPSGGGGYAVRLGGETPQYQGETIEQTFVVDPASTSFAYQYAVVLNDPLTGHTSGSKPYFKIEVLDQTGQPISSCTQLFVVADTGLAGFQLSPVSPSTGGVVYYRPWTLVNFDLTPYINQNITVRFTVAGCTQSGHFGYCYVDASCSALAANVNFCPGNTFLYLSAPGGYAYYQWLDPNHLPIPGATDDTLLVNNPVVGDTFYVYLTSMADTSCHSVLPVVLEYTHIFPNAVSTDESCYEYKDGTLSASGSAGFPPYTYTWNTSPPANTQSVSNVPPGTYIVHMVDSLGCENRDTIAIAPAPRIDTSLFQYTYCWGDEHMVVTAPPGFTTYTWLDENGDTLPQPTPANILYVSDPQVGMLITCILHNPPACPIYDTIVINFNPPSSWFSPDTLVNVFTPNGDGINDFFYPYYDYTVASQTGTTSQPAYDFFAFHVGTYEIWVYDRWGKEVFYSNDYKYGWDGMYNKDKASDGVYYWVAKLTSSCDPASTPMIETGYVHLKR